MTAGNSRVAFLDMGAPYRELQGQIDASVAEVLSGGWYILGERLREFERTFAAFVGADHAIGLANGLDALTLALRSLNVGPGDEVIVPSNTYIATWLAITAVGAMPVPVEPIEDTFNLDPARIEEAITSRTRALMPVHLYGQPCDMDPIMQVAGAHGIAVVEDAAQAHGACYKGRRVGGLGDLTAWSFYPTKNLGALGDAGAVTTSDAAHADRLQVLRNYGSRVRYHNEVLGVNSRLDDLQAAILTVKLACLEEWNARRRRLAERYLDALRPTALRLPAVPSWAAPAWHLFVVRAESAAARESLRAHLAAKGVETLIHYPIAPHRQAAYAHLQYPQGAFPIAERLADTVFSLPIGPHLTDDQQDRVIEAVLSV